MDGQIDFLANHIIESYGIFKKENLTNPKLKPLLDFKFQHSVIDSFDRKEMKAFRRVSGLMKNKKSEILAANFDKNRDLVILSVTSTHRTLPAIILNAIFEDLANYYFNKEFGYLYEGQKILSKKQAEYAKELEQLTPALITEINKSNNYYSNASQLTEKKLNQSFSKLNANKDKMDNILNRIDLSMLQVTPIFEIYHPPNEFPNPEYRSYSWWVSAFVGTSIGVIIAVLMILTYTGIQDFVTLVKTAIKSTD